jgi:hypothetical protein
MAAGAAAANARFWVSGARNGGITDPGPAPDSTMHLTGMLDVGYRSLRSTRVMGMSGDTAHTRQQARPELRTTSTVPYEAQCES